MATKCLLSCQQIKNQHFKISTQAHFPPWSLRHIISLTVLRLNTQSMKRTMGLSCLTTGSFLRKKKKSSLFLCNLSTLPDQSVRFHYVSNNFSHSMQILAPCLRLREHDLPIKNTAMIHGGACFLNLALMSCLLLKAVLLSLLGFRYLIHVLN